MITNITESKILSRFKEIYNYEVEEIDDAIIEFGKWFEENVLFEIYNETELTLVNAWISSGRTFPVLSNIHDYSYILNVFFEPGENLYENENMSQTVSRFLDSTKWFKIPLTNRYPQIPDEDKLKRLEKKNPELYNTVCDKLKFIYESIRRWSDRYNLLKSVLSRVDLTTDEIKKYSPDLYKEVWN